MMNGVSPRGASLLTLTLAGVLSLAACGEVDDTQPDQPEASQTTESALWHGHPGHGNWRRGDYRRRTLTRGADFHATNGIQYGPDGNLYVASVLSRSIGVVDPRSGRILDRIGPERGVDSPDDLIFGPDGSLYWTSFLTGEVGRLKPDGTHQTVAQLAPGVNAIAMSPDGRLFATVIFLDDTLYEIDPDGVEAPRLVARGLGGLNSMQFGPDGHLYGPLWFTGDVVRVDVDSGQTTQIFGGLEVPAAVKFDSNGVLHVVDQASGDVIAYDLDTDAREVVAQVPGGGADNLAFDARDNIYLTNAHDGWVRKVLPSGRTRSLTDEGLVAPGGVAVVPYGRGESVVVADALSMKLVDTRTGLLDAEVHSIISVSSLATPLTANADAGRVLTTSWFANVVQVWDPAVHAVVESHADFATPLNAVRYQGDLVVAELGNNRVVRRAAGTTQTETLAQVPVPTGLATDGDSLWVADWATGRVLRVAEDGQPLATPALVAHGLAQPEGMVVDRDGTLLVVETGADRLTRIDPITGQTSVVEDGLDVGMAGPAGMPPTYIFNDVDVDHDGNIYISVDTDNTVEKLSPRGHWGRWDWGWSWGWGR